MSSSIDSVSDDELKRIEVAESLTGSIITFTKTFYPLLNGREFRLSQPISRESHFITIAKALMKVYRGDITKLMIHVPPRYGKTELLIHFVAMCMARFADCNWLYISYSKDLAETATRRIRDIMTSRYFSITFPNCVLSADSTSKSDFSTTSGGRVYAAGTGGTITGIGAGVQGVTDRFSGALIIDDLHKPEDVLSDTIRGSDTYWYYNTARSRRNNGEHTPIIYIGQKLHEDDAAATITRKEPDWTVIKLPALDVNLNALYPEMHTKDDLLMQRALEPYVFAAQMQQDPIPAGGGLFKKEDFRVLDEEPNILSGFITADTAETTKSHNDETVFSFFGVYKSKPLGVLCLHWLGCMNIRVEPRDLEAAFFEFYAKCMQHKVKPEKTFIEKKSTGVTLVSVLEAIQGLQVRPIDRNRDSSSKASRFLNMQKYIAEKRVTFPKYGEHNSTVIEHMSKITANNSHAHDDICDTCYDAIKIAFIDKIINIDNKADNEKVSMIANRWSDISRAINNSYYGNLL